jgi:hypothetical protein
MVGQRCLLPCVLTAARNSGAVSVRPCFGCVGSVLWPAPVRLRLRFPGMALRPANSLSGSETGPLWPRLETVRRPRACRAGEGGPSARPPGRGFRWQQGCAFSGGATPPACQGAVNWCTASVPWSPSAFCPLGSGRHWSKMTFRSLKSCAGGTHRLLLGEREVCSDTLDLLSSASPAGSSASRQRPAISPRRSGRPSRAAETAAGRSERRNTKRPHTADREGGSDGDPAGTRKGNPAHDGESGRRNRWPAVNCTIQAGWRGPLAQRQAGLPHVRGR